jgi:hypothetical protein
MNVTKELAVFNRITFVEKTHCYLIDGQPTNSPSVTRLLKKFKKPFEKEKMAARVAKRTKRTVAEVIAEWDVNNLYSTTIGSMLHKYVENFYCNKKTEFEGTFEGLGFEEKKKIAKIEDLKIDDTPITFDFQQIDDNLAMTESCAVANFLAQKGTISNEQNTLTICFDIGGSTTDILVLGQMTWFSTSWQSTGLIIKSRIFTNPTTLRLFALCNM